MAAAAAVIALIAGGTACDTIDNDRIPAVPVNIIFSTVATWDTYGVTGALDSRRFILTRTEREPRNFPYPASSSTGFGGVLLVCDYYGNPVAYDLACPWSSAPTCAWPSTRTMWPSVPSATRPMRSSRTRATR